MQARATEPPPAVINKASAMKTWKVGPKVDGPVQPILASQGSRIKVQESQKTGRNLRIAAQTNGSKPLVPLTAAETAAQAALEEVKHEAFQQGFLEAQKRFLENSTSNDSSSPPAVNANRAVAVGLHSSKSQSNASDHRPSNGHGVQSTVSGKGVPPPIVDGEHVKNGSLVSHHKEKQSVQDAVSNGTSSSRASNIRKSKTAGPPTVHDLNATSSAARRTVAKPPRAAHIIAKPIPDAHPVHHLWKMTAEKHVQKQSQKYSGFLSKFVMGF
mmetsp:Transcript_38331/g.86074  ORF Transcript_38331/g.86074 Transcript_38331/m.86074 type:complete len:271 (-) Transcript_38331:11-823(-)